MSASADISAFLKGINAARDRVMAEAAKAVEKFAWHVIGDSQQLCPVLTGALQASGTVGDLVVSGYSITITIGHNTDYAAAVHERLDQRHTQGQAQFLQAAMQANQPKLAPFVAAQLRQALGA